MIIPHPGTTWSDGHDAVRIYAAHDRFTQFFRGETLCELPTWRFVRQFRRVTPAAPAQPQPQNNHPLLERLAALRGLTPNGGHLV